MFKGGELREEEEEEEEEDVSMKATRRKSTKQNYSYVFFCLWVVFFPPFVCLVRFK